MACDLCGMVLRPVSCQLMLHCLVLSWATDVGAVPKRSSCSNQNPLDFSQTLRRTFGKVV